MACRKADIEQYQADLELLQKAREAAQESKDAQVVIDDRLTSLQNEYKATVYASEEFINEFHVLDAGAADAISAAITKINTAIDKLNELLKEASEEEESCSEHNPG